MIIALVLLAFVVGVAMVMGGYTAIARLPQMLLQRRLDTRLQEVSQPIERVEDTNTKMLVKVQNVGPLPAVDRLLANTTKGSGLGNWIDQSGMKLSLSGVLLMACGLGVLLALIAGMIARSSYALPVGAAIGFSLPFVFLSFKRTRRLRAFEEQFPDGLDDQLRLVELHPVRAAIRHDVPRRGRPRCERAMLRDLFRRMVAAGDDDQRYPLVRQRGLDGRPLSFQHSQVCGHGSKTLGIAPDFLDHRMDVPGQLAHFADEALKRAGRGRAEHAHEASGGPGRATSQQRQRRAHDAKLRQHRADPREPSAASDESPLLRRHRQPLRWRIDQHQPDDAIRMSCRIGANHETAE